MPLSSLSSGFFCLPCLLRCSRLTRTPHNINSRFQLSAIRRSEWSRAASTTQTKKVSDKDAPIDNAWPQASSEDSLFIPDAKEMGELGRIQYVRRLINTKSKQLCAANNADTVPFNEVVEEVAGEIEFQYLPVLSRLSCVYGEESHKKAVQDISRILEYKDTKKKKGARQGQLEVLRQLGVIRATGVAEDGTSDVSFETRNNDVYEQLLAKFNEYGGEVPAAVVEKKAKVEGKESKAKPKSFKERRQQLLKEKKNQPSKERKKKKATALPRRVLSTGASVKQRPSPSSSSDAGDFGAHLPKFIEGDKSEQVSEQASDQVPEPVASISQPPTNATIVDTSFTAQVPVNTEEPLHVPTLSFDLSRVLFNPGVYHLQDPRSRVYNFDPYLEKIIPVEEFNWDALSPYVTSSEDNLLREVALKHKKRYIGSSSSMSGAMSQFHFLLSAWRPLDFSTLSRQIEGLTSFTVITRAPASIFLRYRDGVYAVDSDKEHDSPNVLMMHGKSMEKLLTLEKADFEKYRKPKAGEDATPIEQKPESYHYSTVDNFLLRSQLDAYDPRLPGTGMFDLKTRAVTGVRMNLSNHQSGMNYEIKDRFGMWESYEREYFDMIRAAFLKYSLQVRMGRMDGIFVAYHNIARIFGFQYISINELDLALHGQADRIVGDREFRMSIKLMSEMFDRATKEYPGQSLRFTFATSEPSTDKMSKGDPDIYMKVFAEVVTEEEIEKIQSVGKGKIEAYEESMAEGIDPKQEARAERASKRLEVKATPSTLESTNADTDFLDSILGRSINKALDVGSQEEKVPPPQPETVKSERKLLCWTLRIYNEVNGSVVTRPHRITASDRWNVHYTIEQDSSTKVERMYVAAQNKRRSALVFDDDEDRERNFFIRHIMRLNAAGKEWRAEQNASDAGKEKVILYGSNSKPENT